MLLYGLNDDRQLVTLLEPTNVQWNSKYYECGDFSVQIPFEQYNSDIRYLYRVDRKTLGIVQKVSYTYQNNVKYVQMSGYMFEKILDNYVVPALYNVSGNIDVVVQVMLQRFVEPYLKGDNLPMLYYNHYTSSISISYNSVGSSYEVGKCLYSILQPYNMSYKFNYDFANDRLDFVLYKGVNRTSSQTENSYITFSTAFGNINNIEAISDNSNYKNCFDVQVINDYSVVYSKSYDFSGGSRKYRLGVVYTDTYTDELPATISQRILELATKYQNIFNLEANPILGFYTYGVDYEIGDECDIIISDINLSYSGRVIAVYEVYKENTCELSIEIGDKIPTMLMKARL